MLGLNLPGMGSASASNGQSIGVSLSGGGSATQTATTTGAPLVAGSTATFLKNGTSVGTATANGAGVASLSISGLANGDLITVQGVIASGAATASVTASVRTIQVGMRSNVPGAMDATTSGSETAAAGVLVETAPYNIDSIRLEWVAGRQKPQGSTNGWSGLTGGITVKNPAIIYPFPSGTVYPLTWSAASSKTAASNAATGLTDVNASIPTITAGSKYGIYSEVDGTAFVNTYSYRAWNAGGDSYQIGGTMPGSAQSSLGTTTNKGSMPGPSRIMGNTTSTKPVLVIYGDSNAVDQTLTQDGYGNTGLGRLIGLIGTGGFVCDATGILLQYNSSGTDVSPKITIWQAGGAQHAIILFGTNDINGGTAAATVLGYADTLAGLLAAASITPHFCTIPPLNAATGAIQTEANTYNDGLRSRSGTGNYGVYLELSDLVSTGRNTNLWKTSSYQVGDNKHINWANTTVTAAILTDPGGLQAQLAAMGVS